MGVVEQNLTTVGSSIEFRDAIFELEREGLDANGIYARRHGTKGPTYRIVSSYKDSFRVITTDDLFGSEFAPVMAESLATALNRAGEMAPKVDIFTL
jgi:hypothetical protein